MSTRSNNDIASFLNRAKTEDTIDPSSSARASFLTWLRLAGSFQSHHVVPFQDAPITQSLHDHHLDTIHLILFLFHHNVSLVDRTWGVAVLFSE
jgi:hypothetical protein